MPTLKFGLSIRLNNRREINLNIDGNFDEKTVLEALDKILPFIEEENANPIRSRNNFFIFNEKTNKWEAVDIYEQYRKAHERQEANKT